MDLANEERQRNEFRNILFELSESQEILKEKFDRSRIYRRLEALYHPSVGEQSFRHFYSDIFSVLTTVKQGDKPGSIDVLGQNLSEIRKGYQAINTDQAGNVIDISDSINKLYDHVSLDIARMGYSDAADWRLSQESNLANIRAQISEIGDTFNERTKIVEERLGNAQREYIAILGIFAAVVLAFTGGIAFSTSVLQNLHISSIYRIVLAVVIIGLVLVNLLYGLFYYIGQLVNKNAENNLKPLWIVNLVFLLIIIAIIFAWYCGFVEKRNTRINENGTSIQIEAVDESIADHTSTPES